MSAIPWIQWGSKRTPVFLCNPWSDKEHEPIEIYDRTATSRDLRQNSGDVSLQRGFPDGEYLD
jgi:hypothetical protein